MTFMVQSILFPCAFEFFGVQSVKDFNGGLVA